MACTSNGVRFHGDFDDVIQTYPHAIEVTDRRIDFTAHRFVNWLTDPDLSGQCMLFYGPARPIRDEINSMIYPFYIGFSDASTAFRFKFEWF